MKLLRRLLMLIPILTSLVRISSSKFCVESIEETKLVTRSSLSPVQVARNYTCCPNLSCNPPVCTEYVTVMERRWRVENITIIRNMTQCCPGFTMTEATCSPLCPAGCHHGQCTAPGTCTCTAGYRGEICQDMGCTQGRWGDGCDQKCKCGNHGLCDVSTGYCTCLPEYGGEGCEVYDNDNNDTVADTSDDIVIGEMKKNINTVSLMISEEQIITFLGSIFSILFIFSIILTVMYYRCRMNIMKNKHISNQVLTDNLKTVKAPLNDYQKKMSAAKVVKIDYPVTSSNITSVTSVTNSEVDRDLTKHIYTYMKPIRNKM